MLGARTACAYVPRNVTEWIGADYLGMFEQLGVVSVWDQPAPTVTSNETS